MILDCPICKSRIRTQRDNLSPGRYYFYCPSCDNELSFDFPGITNQVVTAAPVEQGSKVNNNFDKSLSGITRNYTDLSQIIIRDRKSPAVTIKPPAPVSEKKETVKTGKEKKTAETAAESHTAGSDTFTDPRDGKVYKTVKIGDQVWMAESLNYDAGEGCWFYDNEPENGKKYGRLYTWEAAKRAVPKGWHLPSEEEFEILLRNLDGKGENAYKQLIPGGSSGFNALLGGFRRDYGNFHHLGASAYFWSSTEDGKDRAWNLNVNSDHQKANMYLRNKYDCFSVRCVKDASFKDDKKSVESFPKVQNKNISRETKQNILEKVDTKLETFTDPRDGKVYKTVKIGDQVWMAENLNYDAEKGCWFYDDKPENGKKYGRLYTWEAMKRAVPEGWRLPTKEEYEILLKNLGGKGENAYNQLIPGGASGFDALFGGWRSYNGKFYNFGTNADFWSYPEKDSNIAYNFGVDLICRKTIINFSGKDNAFSVRLIRNTPHTDAMKTDGKSNRTPLENKEESNTKPLNPILESFLILGKICDINSRKAQNKSLKQTLSPENQKETEDKDGCFTDTRDGKTYKTVKIGNQIWMAENLTYDAGKGSWLYEKDLLNWKKYGRYYTWRAAKRSVPKGWHLPYKEEFEVLLINLGGEGKNAYKQLVPGGSSGFNALFAGWRDIGGNFCNIGSDADFWTASENGSDDAWFLDLDGDLRKACMNGGDKDCAVSVRLIRD